MEGGSHSTAAHLGRTRRAPACQAVAKAGGADRPLDPAEGPPAEMRQAPIVFFFFFEPRTRCSGSRRRASTRIVESDGRPASAGRGTDRFPALPFDEAGKPGPRPVQKPDNPGRSGAARLPRFRTARRSRTASASCGLRPPPTDGRHAGLRMPPSRPAIFANRGHRENSGMGLITEIGVTARRRPATTLSSHRARPPSARSQHHGDRGRETRAEGEEGAGAVRDPSGKNV